MLSVSSPIQGPVWATRHVSRPSTTRAQTTEAHAQLSARVRGAKRRRGRHVSAQARSRSRTEDGLPVRPTMRAVCITPQNSEAGAKLIVHAPTSASPPSSPKAGQRLSPRKSTSPPKQHSPTTSQQQAAHQVTGEMLAESRKTIASLETALASHRATADDTAIELDAIKKAGSLEVQRQQQIIDALRAEVADKDKQLATMLNSPGRHRPTSAGRPSSAGNALRSGASRQLNMEEEVQYTAPSIVTYNSKKFAQPASGGTFITAVQQAPTAANLLAPPPPTPPALRPSHTGAFSQEAVEAAAEEARMEERSWLREHLLNDERLGMVAAITAREIVGAQQESGLAPSTADAPEAVVGAHLGEQLVRERLVSASLQEKLDLIGQDLSNRLAAERKSCRALLLQKTADLEASHRAEVESYKRRLKLLSNQLTQQRTDNLALKALNSQLLNAADPLMLSTGVNWPARPELQPDDDGGGKHVSPPMVAGQGVSAVSLAPRPPASPSSTRPMSARTDTRTAVASTRPTSAASARPQSARPARRTADRAAGCMRPHPRSRRSARL